MQTIQIQLPDQLATLLNQLAIDQEAFIVTAIQKYLVEMQKKLALEKELAEGYQLRNEETQQLLKEFRHIDLENWEDY